MPGRMRARMPGTSSLKFGTTRLRREWPVFSQTRISRFDPDFRRQAEHIDVAVAASPEMANQVIRVNRPG
jgi:hypothetical protein